jgi:hypothetical protein
MLTSAASSEHRLRFELAEVKWISSKGPDVSTYIIIPEKLGPGKIPKRGSVYLETDRVVRWPVSL